MSSNAIPPAAHSDSATVVTPSGKICAYKQVNGKPQNLELYLPVGGTVGKQPVPGIIFFHGGGWKNGSLAQFRHPCHYFASRGLVTATVDYRMLAEGEKDAGGLSHKAICITDAKSAIRWMKQHAAELSMDPQRLIAGGGSAGGHIAVLASTNPGLDDPLDPPDIDTSVVAYLLFNPAFSPTDAATPEVDVMRHLTAPVPPMITFFGTMDTSWKPGGDALMAQVAKLGGHDAQLWLAQEQKHGFYNKQPWLDLTLMEVDRFLVQHGLLTGVSTLAPLTQGEKLDRVP